MLGWRDLRIPAVGLRLRSDARRHWLAWVLLGALLGFVVGVVASGAAAARRTASAYDRLVAATNGADAIIGPNCDNPTCPLPGDLVARLQDLDVVEAALGTSQVRDTTFADATGGFLDPSEDWCYSGSGEPTLLIAPGPGTAAPVNGYHLIRGRAASLPQEVVIAESFSRRSGLEIGDSFLVGSQGCENGPPRRGPRTLELVVVGIEVSVGEIESERGNYIGGIHALPELRPLLRSSGFVTVEAGAVIRLAAGRTADDLEAAMEAAGIDAQVLLGDQQLEVAVEQGLDADEGILWLFVALGGVAAGVLLVPVLTRHTRNALADGDVLCCLGGTARELAAIGGGHGWAIGLASLPMLIATMAGISWFTPPGRARTIDPSRGVELDLAVVGAGVVAVVVFAVVTAALGTLGRGRPASRPQLERTTAAARLARWGSLPPPAAVGVRMALEPRHRDGRVPVRSGLLGLAVAVAAVVGVLAYVAHLDHLRSTPRLAGWNWDAAGFLVGGGDGDTAGFAGALADTPGVAGASIVTFWTQPTDGSLTIVRAGSVDLTTFFMSFSTGPESIAPTVTAGRAPSGPAEVGLNAATLRQLDVAIGDTVELVGNSSHMVSVVGEVVVPLADQTGTQAAGTLSLEGLQQLRGEAAGDWVVFDLDGTAAYEDVWASLLAQGYRMDVLPSTEADVVEVGSLSLEQSRTLPVALGVLLAVAGLGVLVHVQYVVSRGRRRELAVLRTLGFRGPQVAGAVAIQAVVLVVLAFLIGAPIGLLVGRWAWTATAERLGVKAESVVPWTGLVVGLAVSVALAAVASVLPAYQAARRPAAEVLRSE